ncbi:MAG: glycoside hydrolase family 15 protein [Cytophagaceae bacterium]|nr:glycoside hydrolase family 15 protein [Cytophagaceae bacterium]
MKRHTYNYGVIGNCAYMAYVNTHANIVWMCWPQFDSSFVFGSLLDTKKGGEFSITPHCQDFTTNQKYIENTNVLCTEFECAEGRFRVTDFAPRFFQYGRYYKPLMFIRKIEPLSGSPRVKVVCDPVGEYGQVTPEVYQGSSHIRYMGMEQQVRLTSNIPLNFIIEKQEFVLNEVKYLVLTWGIPLEAPLEETAEDFLRRTLKYWQDWVKSTSIGSFYPEQILRSALCLKIHQFEDTGAIIAAGTTSLPESPGSGRNWDYRYCWLRDTYYILNAFHNVGHFEELERYFHYIENITIAEEDRYQPLYSITGRKKLIERVIPLKGYGDNNEPVRVGNQAYEHIQNDVYGQVLVALLPLYVDTRFSEGGKYYSQRLVNHTLKKIEDTMDEPDAGLWEFRTLAQQHCYTFLFHWAGACSALKIGRHFKNEKIIEKAIKLRDWASQKIEACYDPNLGAYTQAIGQPNVDASCLQLITLNYLDPKSEKAKLHLKRIEERLKTPEGLIYRYKHSDDFGEPETTFLICAYWYIEALACVGRVDDAIKEFEKLMQYQNHLGLLSEDVEAKSGSQWGNFPQAYSHVGQLNAAFRISKKLDLPTFL